MITIEQVYKNGAYKGLVMGLYLSVVSIFSMLSDSVPLLSMVALPMLVCLPLLQYRLLYIEWRKADYSATFSSLWMLGITIFIGGSLVCALLTYGYLTLFDPDFFMRSTQAMVDTLQADPQLRSSDLCRMLKASIEAGLVPSPIEFCVQMIMFTVFSGSILSLVLTPIVKLRKPRRFKY